MKIIGEGIKIFENDAVIASIMMIFLRFLEISSRLIANKMILFN